MIQESLSVQFWDKESFVDSPIRSVLYMLEKEYPLRLIEFIRFLSAVCGGAWSAQCVYVTFFLFTNIFCVGLSVWFVYLCANSNNMQLFGSYGGGGSYSFSWEKMGSSVLLSYMIDLTSASLLCI